MIWESQPTIAPNLNAAKWTRSFAFLPKKVAYYPNTGVFRYVWLGYYEWRAWDDTGKWTRYYKIQQRVPKSDESFIDTLSYY